MMSALAPTAPHGRRTTIPIRSAAAKPGSTSAMAAGRPASVMRNAELRSSSDECTARNPRPSRPRVGPCRSDLDDDRQDHRPPAEAVVHELGEVVVEDLLQEVGLADLLLGGAGERRVDR